MPDSQFYRDVERDALNPMEHNSNSNTKPRDGRKRVLVVGAGAAG